MSNHADSVQSVYSVDILILGAGWTSTFLIPLCHSRSVTYAATSRPKNHKPHTIAFEFDENDPCPDKKQFSSLPDARTVLITFPIVVKGASERLVRTYQETRTSAPEGLPDMKPRYIQLGTTSVFYPTTALSRTSVLWLDRHSPLNKAHLRGNAEEELLALSPVTPTTVLDLAGLWGGVRKAKHIVGRVAPTKEALKNRGSLHMIHGEDVSRAILAVHEHFEQAVGERWLLTDGRVHDWWDLAYAWGSGYSKQKGEPTEMSHDKDGGPQPEWVRELMRESGVRALPRCVDYLGKALDSQAFWYTFKLEPVMGRLE